MNIVTLTLAAAFDIHCNAESLVVNRENLASITDFDAGGKGVNISRALKSFGADANTVVVLGRENGAEFVKRLEKENICLQTVEIDGRIRENITIHTADGKETRISFTVSGAPTDILDRVEKITDSIASRGTVLTFTGRLPSGVSVEDAKAYIKRLKEKGVLVILDSRSFSLSDMIEVGPFLIKPNEEEISHYMSRDISDFSDALVAAREIVDAGIENVMISLGAKGAVIASGDEEYTVYAPKIDAVSTIGAGDSSIAGFVYAMSRGLSLGECLKVAVAFGSAACMTPGTNPPLPSDVERLLSLIG